MPIQGSRARGRLVSPLKSLAQPVASASRSRAGPPHHSGPPSAARSATLGNEVPVFQHGGQMPHHAAALESGDGVTPLEMSLIEPAEPVKKLGVARVRG